MAANIHKIEQKIHNKKYSLLSEALRVLKLKTVYGWPSGCLTQLFYYIERQHEKRLTIRVSNTTTSAAAVINDHTSAHPEDQRNWPAETPLHQQQL